MARHFWTDDRLSVLKTRWREGQTAEAIAAEFGPPATGASVREKAYRIGITDRRGQPRHLRARDAARLRSERLPPLTPVGKPAAIDERDVDPVVPAPPPLRAVKGVAAAILTLRPSCCHWPIGDVQSASFRFCCAPKDPASISPYCDEHRRVATKGVAR